jgi:hypothetical protein
MATELLPVAAGVQSCAPFACSAVAPVTLIFRGVVAEGPAPLVAIEVQDSAGGWVQFDQVRVTDKRVQVVALDGQVRVTRAPGVTVGVDRG